MSNKKFTAPKQGLDKHRENSKSLRNTALRALYEAEAALRIAAQCVESACLCDNQIELATQTNVTEFAGGDFALFQRGSNVGKPKPELAHLMADCDLTRDMDVNRIIASITETITKVKRESV